MIDLFDFAGLLSRTFGADSGWISRLDATTSLVAVAIALLFTMQMRGGQLRKRLAREVEEDMEDLRETSTGMKAALDDTKKKMADVTLALAQKSDAQQKKMVGELQIIEALVREFATNVAKKASEQPLSPLELGEREVAIPGSYAPVLADPEMLDIIRRSLEENRVDLYLQPVVSLPQRKVRYYEALSRLRSEDGTVIMPAQYIKIAAPAGLMSVVDNLLLFRCVQVVKRLTQKNRDIGIFCNISGHTLKDHEFFPQFLAFLRDHRDLSGQIVFEFSQDSVADLKPAEIANLKALAELGFRLSMDQVTTLDLDFAKVKKLGFSCLKVRADTLISGMVDANAAVAAEDFKDLLSRNGLNLIAERVEDERSVVQLLEYNVDFAQGYLFGEPRPIREVAEAGDSRTASPAPSNVSFLSAGLAKRLAG